MVLWSGEFTVSFRVRNVPENSPSALRNPAQYGKGVFLTTAKNILFEACQWAFVQVEETKNLERTEALPDKAYAMSRESARVAALEFVDFEWEIEMVGFAYEISQKSHEGVIRRSGRPYFEHPVEAAKILLEDLPGPTAFKIIVALLHDVIEDAKDPKVEKLRLLALFREKVVSKREDLVLKYGNEGTERKISARLQFVETVVEAVDLLAKKKKESYASAWEHPLLAIESSLSDLAETFLPAVAWMFPEGVPKFWERLLKERSKREYFSRMRALAENQLFLSILMVKFADRLANLRDSEHESSSQIRNICEETESEYYLLADLADSSGFIRELLQAEVSNLRNVLKKRQVSEKTKSATSKALASPPGKSRK